jgi:hypothetical protein
MAHLLGLFDRASTALHAILASFFCTWTSVWLVKLAFMVFFHGLGRQIRFQRILWWSVLVFLGASYMITISLMDYRCLTSVGIDTVTKCRTQEVIDFQYRTTRVQTTLDIVTDTLSE